MGGSDFVTIAIQFVTLDNGELAVGGKLTTPEGNSEY